MIIKNTPANAALARKARKVIDAEIGFKAMIDKTWNCGADIRIEVGTTYAPFIVITTLTDENVVDVKIRMTETEDIDELKYFLESLDQIRSGLQKLVSKTPALNPTAGDQTTN